MKIILASVTGVEDGLFRVMWENIPATGYAIVLLGTIIFGVIKLLKILFGLNQLIINNTISIETMNSQMMAMAKENTNRINKNEENIAVVETKVIALDKKIDIEQVKLVDEIKMLDTKIDTKIDGLRQEMKFCFEKVDVHFSGVDDKFRGVDGQFKRVDEQFKGVDQRFKEVNERFEKVDERFKEVDEKFKEVYRRFDAVDTRFEKLEQKMDKNFDTIINLLMSKHDDNSFSPVIKS